jgi:PHD/YefM family antitoxin component YafN of YafNO toxin-antitoxin module
MMNEISFEQFKLNVEGVMRDAANGDSFTTVQMDNGKVVIISEDEWNILREGFAHLVGGKILK